MINTRILPKLGLKYKQNTIQSYITKFIVHYPLDPDQITSILKIYDQIPELVKNGKDPRGFTGALIYKVIKTTEYKITQKNITDIFSITEVTLRNRLSEIKKIVEKCT